MAQSELPEHEAHTAAELRRLADAIEAGDIRTQNLDRDVRKRNGGPYELDVTFDGYLLNPELLNLGPD